MNDIIEKILELVKRLADSEGHPDEVARLYAAQMRVDMRIGKEMLRIRNEHRMKNKAVIPAKAGIQQPLNR